MPNNRFLAGTPCEEDLYDFFPATEVKPTVDRLTQELERVQAELELAEAENQLLRITAESLKNEGNLLASHTPE